MIPRFIHIGDWLSHVTEGFFLVGMAGYSGLVFIAQLISEQDWDRITGPSGVAFVSSLATLVLWGTGVMVVRRLRLDAIARDERKRADDIAMEERLRLDRKAHFDDLKESNKMVVERLIEITTANHEVMLASARTDMKVAEAMHSLETQIQYLTNIIPRHHEG
jgi:hypothetical protein